jgi:nucleotide-binding universal stress UspA family protein
MGRSDHRALRDAFLGSTAERVIRRAKLPVLAVRLPEHGPYRRPALAVDFDEAANSVLVSLLRLLPPRPSLAVIHACESPYQGLAYPSLMAEEAHERREHLRKQAAREVQQWLVEALRAAKVPVGERPRSKLHVRYDAPRTTIERAVLALKTDLLVLGTHAHAGMAHVFLGTVAGDVLREVRCDVLVVPPHKRVARVGG